MAAISTAGVRPASPASIVGLLLSLAIGALLTACQPAADKPAAAAIAAAKQASLQAAAATRLAADQAQGLRFAGRADFVAALQEQLIILNHQVEALDDVGVTTSRATQAELAPRVEALREQTRAIHRRLDEVINATPATWDITQAEAEKAHAALRNAVAATRLWLNQHLRP